MHVCVANENEDYIKSQCEAWKTYYSVKLQSVSHQKAATISILRSAERKNDVQKSVRAENKCGKRYEN